jgi:hypothetical protein
MSSFWRWGLRTRGPPSGTWRASRSVLPWCYRVTVMVLKCNGDGIRE